MMKIMFYKPEYANYDVDSEFLYSFDYTKIDVTDPWIIRILKEIDNIEALAPNVFKVIGKEWYSNYKTLSTGCKAMLLIYYEHDFVLDLCCVGDNCEQIIADLSLIKNFTVEYHTDFLTFIGMKIHALCLNDGKEFFDAEEMLDNADKYEDEYDEWVNEVIQDAWGMEEA